MSSPVRYTARGEAHRVRLALEAHDKLDTERFSDLKLILAEVHADIKSLLASRSYVRGAWAAIVALAAAVSGIVAGIAAWLK